MAVCAVCLSAVPHSHERRKLYGSSTATELTQLKRLALCGGYSVRGNKSLLPTDREKSFLCLKCFSLLRRKSRMREELTKLEGELEANMNKVAVSLGIQATSSETVPGNV